ncbi:site-specific DNA-methyltransferase [Tistrella mobilis]|uniref:site-specific DNA-methyltransferase (adenine-specific) n=1 Tax=Tistrella mobilis (strain KA081020-065) TaxID=1110502 RepID=I3TWV0_TISMK|nr:site-specific DNA-methyltransferase [Tistrella mobilis]AFK57238.1 DNA methylase N-4/N-6 [Tistrella mobilis KA081020-065]
MARKPIEVTTLKHDAATRRNIPTAELEAVMTDGDKAPLAVAYARRNPDLDPQLIWRGKEAPGTADAGAEAATLNVAAPPLYIQEKVHPQVLIEDLRRETEARAAEARAAEAGDTPDLFADFNGLPDGEAVTEFYAHDQHWSNRMILGDSLSVMASLAEREGLRGQVQCIYFDPPYGIKFNSNFQWSTTTRDVKDGDRGHVTREPEQVRAFRDTWRDGIHSYLSYIRDRLTVARDLLSESGSIFVQIGDENVHRVRAVMDEVMGPENYITSILIQKTGSQYGEFIQNNFDYILWYSKSKDSAAGKYRPLFEERQGKSSREVSIFRKDYNANPLTSDGYRDTTTVDFYFEGGVFHPGRLAHWKVTNESLERVGKAGRIIRQKSQIRLKYFYDDFPVTRLGVIWSDVGGASGKVYVVQTSPKIVERCLLMATDPGDLVLDPTCGSGTTAYVAEQWGRRWITIDTSRVSLALARSRIMGARYPYYLLADSEEGRRKEAEVTQSVPRSGPVGGDIRQGFVYERVPHITLKSIANNPRIDEIWEDWQARLEPLRAALNTALGKSDKAGTAWEEWQIPREAGRDWPEAASRAHAAWWEGRIARQREIDAAIAARADSEFLYDRPYIDRGKVRVAGPFTVETLSPHRTLAVDWDDELIDTLKAAETRRAGGTGGPVVPDFAAMILDNLRAAGVQQAHKEDRISFTSLTGWPGDHICAEGRFFEGADDTGRERRAGILVGPEFGTVSRADLVAAAREAGDAGFDLLIACAFNYDAHAAELDRLGRVQVLRARMNPDLHMSADLKTTGSGNLFVIFGEPDIRIEPADEAGADMIRVRIQGVDVFKPQSGEVISEGPEGIALWMLDTAYNEESFFVRHAYFLGANDPYKALRTTLRAEIDQDAWDSLHSDISRPFPRPATGRIAVKVINHLGDEVMKVFQVD